MKKNITAPSRYLLGKDYVISDAKKLQYVQYELDFSNISKHYLT